MRPCEEGFLYPVVDSEKCVRCYKCLSVCPIKKADGGKAKADE
ncbi:MAG: 4Fe-4S binding protein [Lachnospiraceae bacterium]|nr:4Fe-4S binding protein [Lachnospiraceae bacterium]